MHANTLRRNFPRPFTSKLISFGQIAKVASPLFNLHACQRLRMFIFISFMRLSGRVCFEIRGDLGKRGRRCWVRSRGREEEWGGRRWLKTHVTNDTGPQCPSVNSMCGCPHVCLCVCSAVLYGPAPGVLWVVAPVCGSAVTSLYEPSFRLSRTQKRTQRDTRGAWPAMSLKSQETQMWQQINVVWPRSTHRSTHTLRHTQSRGVSRAAHHTTDTLKTINGTCNA